MGFGFYGNMIKGFCVYRRESRIGVSTTMRPRTVEIERLENYEITIDNLIKLLANWQKE